MYPIIIWEIKEYACYIDPIVLRAINEISLVKSKPITDTLVKAQILLDYAPTYPNTII